MERACIDASVVRDRLDQSVGFRVADKYLHGFGCNTRQLAEQSGWREPPTLCQRINRPSGAESTRLLCNLLARPRGTGGAARGVDETLNVADEELGGGAIRHF